MSPSAFSVLLLSLLINGCGSSNHASATSRAAPPARRGAGTTTTAASTPGQGGTSATPPSAPTSQQQTTSAAGASNVRLPATFVITARGSLKPASVSAPGNVTIQLTVISGDAHAHRVVLRTTPARALAVPRGGRASARLSGLRPGRYSLEVDGATAGALVVGAQPGP